MNKGEFEQFYRENVNRIYRYVFFRVGRNEEVAQDLVSEIFMKALNAFDSYDPNVSKSAWIYRIAHNHLANYYRDHKQAVDQEDVAEVLIGSNGVREMERRGDEMRLEAALRKLPPDERQLVTFKYIDGYSYQEMSEILERTPDALKVATHRGMQKLKKLCSDSNAN